jgi:predicted NBD/HSP70 family sugar kinase
MALSDTAPAGSGPTRLKRLNRTAIVELVKRRPGISRSEVVERTGLTKSTISVLVQELIEEGWLREGDSPQSSEIGRPRTPLSLDGHRLGLLGAEIAAGELAVLGCNLLGEVLHARRIPHDQRDVDSTASALARLIAEAHETLSARRYRVLGAAVGVPGVIESDASRVRFAPALGWRDAPLGDRLRAALGPRRRRKLPVTLLDEARASALSQYVFGAQTARAEPLVYLSLGTTVGAGIVVGGRLQRGNNGLAGQVGHMVLEPDGRRCGCGRRGCAETLVSQTAVSRLITGKEAPVLSVDEIAGRLAAGDGLAAEALARAGRRLGLLMLNIGSAINPAEFVLGGPLAQLGDPFVTAAVETLRAELGRFDHHDVSVRICHFGRDACAIGAAASVLLEAMLE